ncbi:MAG: hypothetical protein OXG96_14815, partial [Acidobacteria bacterium]|nr:hypothetical protein [Acidobacteriota bacterium]
MPDHIPPVCYRQPNPRAAILKKPSLLLQNAACADIRERQLRDCAEMIQMLPGTYRQILDLRLYQGLSTRQTAERL